MIGPRLGPPNPAAPSPTPLGPPLQTGDVIRAVVLGLVAFVIGKVVVAQFAAGTSTAGGRVNYVLGYYACWSFAWIGAIWFVFVRRRGLSFADLGYVVPSPAWAARGVLGGFLALPAAFTLYMVLRPIFGTQTSVDLQQYFGGADFTVIHALAMILYAGFLVPIAEELLFRGLVFRWLRQRLDFAPAAFISAALFGLAHQRPDQIVIAGLLGLPLAWLYERSGSLAPAILLHQTYNSLTLMMTFAAVWFGGTPAS